jgi:hypothetical protein
VEWRYDGNVNIGLLIEHFQPLCGIETYADCGASNQRDTRRVDLNLGCESAFPVHVLLSVVAEQGWNAVKDVSFDKFGWSAALKQPEDGIASHAWR